MRVLAATGICVALAAAAGGAQAREVSIYRGKCGEMTLPTGPTGLESAVRIRTSCGVFAAGADGVRFVGPYRPPWRHDGLLARRGRLVLYDRDRIIWRSRGRNYRGWSWTAGSGGSFAFIAYGGRLYIANVGRAERVAGRINEFPLGWTRRGLLVTSQQWLLRVRTRSGRLVRVLEEGRGARAFDSASRTLLYVTPDRELVRTDGLRAWKVASLPPFRLRAGFELRPLEDGRVALVGNRLVVLDANGSTVAADRRHYNLPVISSRGAIAMVSTGPLDRRSRARESVRLLRPGDRSSTVLYVNEVGALGCGHWPSLAWRGTDLLYSTNEGAVVVIDSRSGSHIDLGPVVRRLPGRFLQASWA
jgi:hypothetical protein